MDKVARAIPDVTNLIGRLRLNADLRDEPTVSSRFDRNLLREAADALAVLAAMGEREGEPVAWQYFDPHDKVWEHCDDPDHFRNELGWQVRPLYASPRPEAVGEAVKAEMAQPTNEKGVG